jgi:di/tricarboxylate transporter
MPWEAWLTLVTVLVTLYVLATNRGRPDAVLVSAAISLTTLSLVSPRFPGADELVRSVGNEGVLTVALLFIVVAGLVETGGMTYVAGRLFRRPRTVRSAQIRLMLPVATISAFLNNTPVVAAFMPVVQDWARKASIAPSKLFIPLSYAAVLGGCCTLVGTSTTLLIQALLIDAARTDPAVTPMSLFTITPIGIPVAIVGLGFVVIAGSRLLPDRRTPQSDRQDARQYALEMVVEPGSAIEGNTIEEAGLRHLPGMYLASLQRAGEQLVAVGPDQRLLGNDRLEFVGVVDSVVSLRKIRGLSVADGQVFKLNGPQHDRCLVEAVVSGACPLVGKTVRDGQFRTRYDAAIIAVHRDGERVASKIGDIVLRPGDTLLLETHPKFLKYYRNSRDFFLTSGVDNSAPLRHDKAWLALAILAGLILATGLEALTGISIFQGALIAAALMVLAGCCSIESARNSVDWSVVITIAASLVVGRAIATTGLAQVAASGLVNTFQFAGPWGVLVGIYVFTLLLTEIVTNNAAAVLAFPVAQAAAAALGVSFMPMVIAIAIAASAGFATPLGYQTHLMVYGPGGYRFSDFVRIGMPLDFAIMLVTVALCPVIYPF